MEIAKNTLKNLNARHCRSVTAVKMPLSPRKIRLDKIRYLIYNKIVKNTQFDEKTKYIR